MNAEEIRKELRRQPFVPLRFYLSDGKTYEVKHPEMVFLTRSWMYVGVESKLGSGVAEDHDLVSLMHVVRVELAGKPSAAAS
ncbi:MAG: hypothetical protein JNM56_37140 [Planctomycetia bacterium]|nr:hypothetical protein [Planctomycetia bacterium]